MWPKKRKEKHKQEQIKLIFGLGDDATMGTGLREKSCLTEKFPTITTKEYELEEIMYNDFP